MELQKNEKYKLVYMGSMTHYIAYATAYSILWGFIAVITFGIALLFYIPFMIVWSVKYFSSRITIEKMT